MSPRKRRTENIGLPKGWRRYHGAYYYRVPKGLEHLWDGKQQFRLGKTLTDAYRTWADRMVRQNQTRTIADLLDRYSLEVIPAKAPKTQESNRAAVRRLATAFGNWSLESLKPRHVYLYVDKRTRKIAAHREIEVLSHAFTKAVEWGLLDQHPFKGQVILRGEQPRTRYVRDEEVIAALGLSSTRKRGSVTAIQAYIRLKLLTGLRRGDLLRLRVTDLREDGIYVGTSKTGKPVVYEWNPDLREAVTMAKNARPIDISPYIFCNQKGQCYYNETVGKASGWESMWQRFMKSGC